MHSHCTACIVKPSDRSPHDRERATEARAVVWVIQPARCATGVRERNEKPIAVSPTPPDNIAQRNASPETLDREGTDKEDDARSDKSELRIEPRRAERDLGWRRTTVPRSACCLPRKALRDRGAVGQMRFIDAGLREPAPQLSAGASGEWKTGRELHRARRLADDHHAIARIAGDDGER